MAFTCRIGIECAYVTVDYCNVRLRGTIICHNRSACVCWCLIFLTTNRNIIRTGSNDRVGKILNGDGLYAFAEVTRHVCCPPCTGDNIIIMQHVGRIGTVSA